MYTTNPSNWNKFISSNALTNKTIEISKFKSKNNPTIHLAKIGQVTLSLSQIWNKSCRNQININSIRKSINIISLSKWVRKDLSPIIHMTLVDDFRKMFCNNNNNKEKLSSNEFSINSHISNYFS